MKFSKMTLFGFLKKSFKNKLEAKKPRNFAWNKSVIAIKNFSVQESIKEISKIRHHIYPLLKQWKEKLHIF